MKQVDVKEQARQRELRVLQQWAQDQTFKRSVEGRAGKPNFVFYEGPPTANGAPHIGHVLGRVIKDFICRYKTMTGYRVVRKAGWDTHGLPVELGVEKQLGISGKQEIERYGVAAFVEKCKDSVFEYEKQWRELTEAIGYWTDMDDPYITLKNEYIESVWHLLSEIHKKGLLYKGHRVSPYCPCCQTTLSSHEVAQGYEDVKDLSATVKFKLEGREESIIAWTTTPWTLPANVALAVNRQLTYVKAKQGGEVLIVAENRAEAVLKSDYEIIGKLNGSELVGLRYTPPFRYVGVPNAYVVIDGEFVTDQSGTGIVHIAPAHGEDDYKAAVTNGIGMLSVVDTSGRYVKEVTDLAGRFVKDCDVDIVKLLSGKGLLYAKERYEHSYPFCWRCKSPLLYYAMESWFIRTTAVKEQLIANNRQVDWYPDHIRDGRFGKFLEELIDWNISRTRYWGTPLNVWVCSSCRAEYAPSGIAELRSRAVSEVASDLELHKPYVDEVKVRCHCCEDGVMERTPEVIDVWFDSGSMPFAQYHAPFENQATFESQYPADMICEGIDQTRGWFFSLLAVSTLFNGKAPYKAVLSTGHILDENGQKMSKSKGNVIDPWEIINQFGSDAFRWALLADSAPWNSKRFSRQIVAEAKSKVIDTIVNTHAFYALYASIDGYEPSEHEPAAIGNILDRWIQSRLNSLLQTVVAGLEANDFLNPAKAIESFVDDMSNWYVRRSRDRFWGSGLSEDKVAAYQTLGHVLLTLAKLAAPYTPFLADDLYRNLGGPLGSVHLDDYPQADGAYIDLELEQQMETVRNVVELARSVRNETGIKTRQPLSELIVSTALPFDEQTFGHIIEDEINVKSVRLETEESGLVDVTLKLNLKSAGPKFGKWVGELQRALRSKSAAEAADIVKSGIYRHPLSDGGTADVTLDDLLVEQTAKPGYAAASGYRMTVALNTELTKQLVQEGLVREVVRAVQDYRKKLALPIDKRVDLVLHADADVKEALTSFERVLFDNVLLNGVRYVNDRQDRMETASIGDRSVGMYIE